LGTGTLLGPTLGAIGGFGRVMRENLTSGSVSFRKAYIQSIVDAVEVDDDPIRIEGSKEVLEQAALATRSDEIQCSQMRY
jgi:hypothetical protein